MVRGFSQKEGVEYEETFSLVVRYSSVKDVVSIDLVMRWRIHQMDVNKNLLNRIIEEEPYIKETSGL
jgi:hypothetical protein